MLWHSEGREQPNWTCTVQLNAVLVLCSCSNYDNCTDISKLQALLNSLLHCICFKITMLHQAFCVYCKFILLKPAALVPNIVLSTRSQGQSCPGAIHRSLVAQYISSDC